VAIAYFCPRHVDAGLGSVRAAGVSSGPASFWLVLGLFLLAWQSMIAAMMLPSSLPLVRLFGAASARAPARASTMVAFLGGYALTWTAFGAAAFSGDALLHHLIGNGWLILGGALALAGAVQFTSLKERCLTQCRHPGTFLMRHYRRGAGGAFALGLRHGLFCLGCCWALMLVMFAAGAASLIWMGGLTALMVVEKTARRGGQAVAPTGFALLGCAALVLAHPHWLPALLGG
jgi:predicted metal-binding membrane protein